MAAVPQISMYNVNPYYARGEPLILPSCMYKVESYFASDPNCENVVCASNNALTELEKQQDEVLSDLESLKNELQKLSCKVGDFNNTKGAGTETRRSPPAVQAGCAVVPKPPQMDIVVAASCKDPPLSLLVLQRLIRSHGIACSSAVHVHSTVNGPVGGKLLRCFEKSPEDPGRDGLIITLIWKQVDHGPELVVSAHNHVPIHGEANVAKYLCRVILPHLYSQLSAEEMTMADEWIDQASMNILQGSPKEKAAALRNLNSHLGRCTWLVGDRFTLADLVMWSSLTKSGEVSSVGNNVKKWFNSCSSSFRGFLEVNELLVE